MNYGWNERACVGGRREQSRAVVSRARGTSEKSPVPRAAWRTFNLLNSRLTTVRGSLVLLRTGAIMKAHDLGKHHSK